MAEIDLIKRFSDTPIETMVRFSERSIRLETNCQTVADHIRRALGKFPGPAPDSTDFIFRIVAESEDDLGVEAASVTYRHSSAGLAFITLGRTTFLVGDLRARRGMSFVSKDFVADADRFRQHFLPALVSILDQFVSG